LNARSLQIDNERTAKIAFGLVSSAVVKFVNETNPPKSISFIYLAFPLFPASVFLLHPTKEKVPKTQNPR